MARNDVTTLQPEDEGLGPMIQRLRLELGWSQDTLALRAGMNRGYLSQIEGSKTKWPAKYVGALARELGVRPSLLGRAAGKIVRDTDYGWDDDLITEQENAAAVRAILEREPPESPWQRVVFAGMPSLSEKGQRAMAEYFRVIEELDKGYRKEAERDAKEDRDQDR